LDDDDDVDNDIDNDDDIDNNNNDDDIDNDNDVGSNINNDTEDPGSNIDNLDAFGNEHYELKDPNDEYPNDEDPDEDLNGEGNLASLGCGDKRRHSHTGLTSQWRDPVKINLTTGVRPKARDYEAAVQTVLAEAIPLYHRFLSLVTPYPASMDELRWAKKSWKDACEKCETLMAPNNEIIKMVSAGCWLLLAANQHVVLTFSKDHHLQLALSWPGQNWGCAACQHHVWICCKQ
jgi:hypothetical protein